MFFATQKSVGFSGCTYSSSAYESKKAAIALWISTLNCLNPKSTKSGRKQHTKAMHNLTACLPIRFWKDAILATGFRIGESLLKMWESSSCLAKWGVRSNEACEDGTTLPLLLLLLTLKARLYSLYVSMLSWLRDPTDRFRTEEDSSMHFCFL